MDFCILNFTDTFSQGFSRFKFYAKLPISGDICTQSHGNEGSLFLRLVAHSSYQYKLSLAPQAKGREHSVLSSCSVYNVVSRSQSSFPARLATRDYSQCGYDLPHEVLVSRSQTFLHRALIDYRFMISARSESKRIWPNALIDMISTYSAINMMESKHCKYFLVARVESLVP